MIVNTEMDKEAKIVKDVAAAGSYVSARNATHIIIAIPSVSAVDVELDWYAEV